MLELDDERMDRRLGAIGKAYDLTVEQYRIGTDPLKDVSEDIRSSQFYRSFAEGKTDTNSAAADINEYLCPEDGMRFLDVGCCANLVNYRLDRWPSNYYGVDISPALVNAMKAFVARQGVSIGGLHVAELARLPFADGFFDIAAVIGVLEYCSLRYIRKGLLELNRVMRPGSRVIVDVPNRDHPYARDMARLEEYLERPIVLHFRSKFEDALKGLFSIDHVGDSNVMIKYFVRKVR
ncbi:MAG: hypothetical protein A2147_10710 [Chloroflexi bacterium RBG_16_57_8]|nr:MAG: hypothetical protein A2147_10710 [Chloroflexi bacterium RBG_16_57_8]